MNYQGLNFRGPALRFIAMASAAAGLAGCAGAGGVKDDGGAGMVTPPSSIKFEITQDATDKTLLVVDPQDGDAILEAVANPPDNKIVWHAGFDFGIKFVQVDDPTKKPKKKFGPNQADDWNTPQECNAGKTSCTLTLDLYPASGKPKGRKDIIAAKYIVASPSGCTDTSPIPANCIYQDPVLIVRN